MIRSDSSAELDEKLRLLEENFLQQLRKISEKRLELERQTVKVDSPTERSFDKNVFQKTWTVRLESSLSEKLAKTRAMSDSLEDRLQETRVMFEEKLKTIERTKAELDRRENVLIRSIQQIEAYLRAVFYLKWDADQMRAPLRNAAEEQRDVLRRLTEETNIWHGKKASLSEAIRSFQPAKLHLERLTEDLAEYSSARDVVEYYLVLELLQQDLIAEESHRVLEESQKRTIELDRHHPATLLSRESTFLRLRSRLKNIRVQITELEEQVEAATLGQLQDAAARFDFQKWIRKLYSSSIEHRPPEKVAGDALSMLEGIRDFVADALVVTERLKGDGEVKDWESGAH